MTPIVATVSGASVEPPRRPIPGAREAGLLTTFGGIAANMRVIPAGPSSMDASTIAERQREGGGGAQERKVSRKSGTRI